MYSCLDYESKEKKKENQILKQTKLQSRNTRIFVRKLYYRHFQFFSSKKRKNNSRQSVNTLKYILNPTPSPFRRFAFRSFEKQSRSNTNRVHAPEYDTRILFTVQYFNHAYRTRKTHTFTSTFTLSRHLRACGRACPSIPVCLHIYLTKRPKAWINSLA